MGELGLVQPVGWLNAAVGRKTDDCDRRWFHHRPRLKLRKEVPSNIEPTAQGGEKRRTDCYHTMTDMPAGLPFSRAPGWGGVAATAAPGRIDA